MTVRFNVRDLGNAASTLFYRVDNTIGFFRYCALMRGSMPYSPDDLQPSDIIASATFHAQDSGTPGTVGFIPHDWTTPAGGQILLAQPKEVLATSGPGDDIGYAVFSDYPLSVLSGGGVQTRRVMMSVGLVGSGAPCILSALDTRSGSVFIQNLDIRYPVAHGVNNMNTPLANLILATMFAGTATGGCELGISRAGAEVTIEFYDGAMPQNADLPPTGTLLATIAAPNDVLLFSPDSFSSSNANIGSFNELNIGYGTAALVAAPIDNTSIPGEAFFTGPALAQLTGTAIATGTAAYFRYKKLYSGVTYTMQGTVGSSGADMIVQSESFVSSQSITITDFVISF